MDLSFFGIRCLPSQYLIQVNYPIKRLYIIGSIILFIIDMFIYRICHNEQEILKQIYQKNNKSIIVNGGFISLTLNYCSLCQHPYYLGIFIKYPYIKQVFSIV